MVQESTTIPAFTDQIEVGAEISAVSTLEQKLAKALRQNEQLKTELLAERTSLFKNGYWVPRYLKRLTSRSKEVSFLWFALCVWAGVSHKKRELRRQVHKITELNLIDEAWYRAHYGTLDGALLSPALHYLRTGTKLFCNPNPLFATQWFLKRYKSKIPKGSNPLLYYIQHGVREKLDPCSLFDTNDYLFRHPEIERQGVPPLSHYLTAQNLKEAYGFPLNQGAANPPGGATHRKRVLYVSGEWDVPGNIYRIKMYADALAKRGYEVKAVDLFETEQHIAFLEKASAVVLWRAPWDKNVELILSTAKRTGAKVVFDVDDLMIKPELTQGDLIDGLRIGGINRDHVNDVYTRIRKTATAADFCTAPTEPLISALRGLQKPGFLLPNGFDEETYLRTRRAVAYQKALPDDGLIRIGYAGGTRTHQKDFGCAAPAIAKVLRNHPECRLVLFRKEDNAHILRCLELEEFPEFAELESQIEWLPFRPLRELPDALAQFDINLAPLEHGNEFCEAKSELKYFEAALAEIPTIASPTVPFAKAIQHGETGFLASNIEEWTSILEELIANPKQRERVGKAAFDAVYWKYGPERRAQLVGNVMEQILGDPDHAAEAFQFGLMRPERPGAQSPVIPKYEVIFESGGRAQSSVAVIVPVYNQAHHLEEALDSVMAQTLQQKDLIVIDDCSSDESLEVALRWLRRNASAFGHVALLKNEVNSGLALTRNAGFAFTDALYCLPLDADNALKPACLDECLKKITQTGAAVVYPVIERFGEKTGVMGLREWIPQWMSIGNYVDAMALIRRSVWAVLGGYQEMQGGWEDYDLWCRLIESGLKGINLPEVLARYRVHSSSMLHTETTAPEVLQGLWDEMAQKHPWLDLQNVPASR